MNRVKAAPCNPNDIDYFCEKNSISQSEKKCLAFRGSLQPSMKPGLLLIFVSRLVNYCVFFIAISIR